MRKSGARPRYWRISSAVVAVGVLASMAACSSGTGGTSSKEQSSLNLGKPTAGAVKPNALKGITLTYAGDGGNFQQAQEDGWVQPFAKASGAKVLTADDSLNTAKIASMVDTHNVTWNAIYGGGAWVAQNCGKYAIKLDKSKLDLSDIPANLVAAGGPCQVPIDVEAEVVVYDGKKYTTDQPSSMADFFNFKKYPGKRGVPGAPGVPDVNFIDAVSTYLSGKDHMHPVDFDKVFKFLSSIKNHLTFWQTYPASQNMLESGDVVMAWVAVGRPYQANVDGFDWYPIWNTDQYTPAFLWIPKGAPNLDATYALVNYALGPAGQAHITEKAIYAPSNSTAKPNLTAAQERFYLSPELQKQGSVTDIEYWAKNYNTAVTKWSAWLQGGH